MSNPTVSGHVAAWTGALLAAVLLLAVAFRSAADENVDQSVHGNAPTDGKTFFYRRVVPRLVVNGCTKCHSRGSLRPNVLVYEELIRRLAIGDSDVNNAVIYKIANLRSISPDIPNHPGGQRCATIDEEPCWSIRAWWEIEFGVGQRADEEHGE